MALSKPTTTDFKDYFDREFPYIPTGGVPTGGSELDYVRDKDIVKASDIVKEEIRESLFSNQNDFNRGYLLLTAHYLIMNIRGAGLGLAGGEFEWINGSKSVGSVSNSVAIPDKVMRDPYSQGLSKTFPGGQYLIMIYPRTQSSVMWVAGGVKT